MLRDLTLHEGVDVEFKAAKGGLLLAVYLDAAFDKGLITVDQNGSVIPSPGLSQMSLQVLGLTRDKPIVQLGSQHQPYMDWHREHVFRK